MPLETVCPNPNGLPIARTRSPTSNASESPNRIAGNFSPRKYLGVEFAPVREHDFDAVGILNDVMVGDDDTASVDNHPGTERIHQPLAPPAEGVVLAEKTPEKGIVEEG
jgi:hypothetical protein